MLLKDKNAELVRNIENMQNREEVQSVRYKSCLDQSERQKDTSHIHACKPNSAKDKAQGDFFRIHARE